MTAIRPILIFMISILFLLACGSSSNMTQEMWLQKLRATIYSKVESRQMNQDNSRFVDQALDENALKNMMRHQVRAAIGQGELCRDNPKCGELGFQSDDWFYIVGEGDEEVVGKRPMFIVGFDHSGTVGRVWNLTVH